MDPHCSQKWTYIGNVFGDFMYGCTEAAVYKCCDVYSIPIVSQTDTYTETDINNMGYKWVGNSPFSTPTNY